jgi:hypothetical protein
LPVRDSEERKTGTEREGKRERRISCKDFSKRVGRKREERK